jgi:uncharacterized membrane protein (DUF2068 family)
MAVGRQHRLVVLIGLFKLAKAALLITLGVAALRDAPQQLYRRVAHAVAWSGIHAGRHTVQRAMDRLWSLNETTARHIAIVSLCYAGVFLVEGFGLVRRRRWAEWLTVVVTASFIPVEIYEMVDRFSAAKMVALAVNVAIVAYLIWLRLDERRAAAPAGAGRPATAAGKPSRTLG